MEPIFTNEADAWDAIADTLEMTRALTPSVDGGRYNRSKGLCSVVGRMGNDGVIDLELEEQMERRLDEALSAAYEARNPHYPYLFRQGALAPRIKQAREFAAAARREGV